MELLLDDNICLECQRAAQGGLSHLQANLPINSNNNSSIKLRKSTVIYAGFLLKPITFREIKKNPWFIPFLSYAPSNTSILCRAALLKYACTEFRQHARPLGGSKTCGMTNFLTFSPPNLYFFPFTEYGKEPKA